MAKLRKFVSYRRPERAYTRRSKFREKSYIKANPVLKVVRFNMGDPNKKFDYTLHLISTIGMQIRHNAIEAARQTSNKILEEDAGKNGYFMRIRIYPHHILRENPLASGAGADRMSTGMQLSFGKPIGAAARIRSGQILFEISVNKEHLGVGKEAMRRIKHKIPCKTTLRTIENKKS
ncbi:50S ribosomal protein L16 [Candidatus Woesearchaeota archaeon]|nr:50S ribosomal protein L16 [Candidatus Woesearchaeota archaeon]